MIKRIFSVLIFGVSVFYTCHGQVANQPSNLEVCDDNSYDGFAVFDLTVLSSEVLNGQNPANYEVSYFTSQENANSNTNAISNTSNFVNTLPITQIIYIRVTENATGSYDTTTVTLTVNPPPIINLEDTYVLCQGSQISLNTGMPPSVYTFEWFDENFVPISVAGAGHALTVNSPGTYYITVTNSTTLCSSTKLILVEEEIPPVIDSSISSIEICDGNSDETEIFDLTVNESEIINGQTGLTITYYESEDFPYININNITNQSNYTNISNPQTIYIRVENSFGCFVVGSFIIKVNDCNDSDSDGVINSDEDINNNGNLDDDDTDNDTIPNYLDDDDDGDLIDTIDELVDQSSISRSFNNSMTIIDTDSDTIENYLDDDDDDDGVLTKNEDYNNNGTPLDDDTNNNNIPDYLEETVALNINNYELNSSSIYPNPTDSLLFADLTNIEYKNIEVKLYDVFGKLVINKKYNTINGNLLKLDLSHLNSGMYFIDINHQSINKIVVK